MAPTETDRVLARKSRIAGLGIAGTMLVWMLLQLIGADYNWPPKYALLVDLFALAGLIWALSLVFQIWRARRKTDRA
ncbi:MAG: DUF5337 domain-containing protein [Cypionkella sp.]|nr:DUF5337 domain-containing protein [Cypionkella sp.]